MEWAFDLEADESRRRIAMLEAMGDWSPIEAFEDEAEAYRILYSGLDAEQTRIYNELVAAGVLP